MANLIKYLVVYIVGIVMFLVAATACENSKIKQTSISYSKFGVDSLKIQELTNDIANEKFPKTNAVIIYKDQELIYEKYANGFNRNQKQYTASVSKTAGNILVGIAMQQGIIKDIESGILDQSIYKIFPKYKDQIIKDSLKSKILFRHILSMTGGLQWDEKSFSYNDTRNDWIAASNSDDPIKYLLNKPMASEPGKIFNYNGGYSIMLSYLIENKTKNSALQFAKEYLFKPLNIKDFEWESISNGLTDTDGGLHLRPIDMAKLGQLYLNKGKWNGRQIVSKKWIEESIKEHIISAEMPNYGFQWWCGDFNYKGKKAFTYFASGMGGQKIFVFPEFNSVIVITHEVFNNPIGELNNIKMLSNYLLPALDKHEKYKETYKFNTNYIEKYIGNYVNSKDSFTIDSENNELYLIAPNEPKLKLIPTKDHKFKVLYPQGVEFHLNFKSDASLNINSVIATIAFREIMYKKSF